MYSIVMNTKNMKRIIFSSFLKFSVIIIVEFQPLENELYNVIYTNMYKLYLF